MKHRLMFFALFTMLLSTDLAQMPFYRYTVVTADGDSLHLNSLEGKVVVVVNSATKCGFTPQYKELQSLYSRFHNLGLEILDFPCNQFGEQAPGTNAEIHAFCTEHYAVEFPQMDKIDVNGDNAEPLFTLLKREQPFNGFGEGNRAKLMHRMMLKKDPAYESSPDIKWNFTKFVIDRKGNVVARFEPTADMKDLEKLVEKLLAEE